MDTKVLCWYIRYKVVREHLREGYEDDDGPRGEAMKGVAEVTRSDQPGAD